VALALPLYVIVPTFYSESIGLSVAAVGTVLLTIRLFDAATDPVFAWLADRWRGRGGRRRGFFLASLPLTAGSAFMLFWSPVEAGLGCLAFWAALVSIGFTWTPLPYTAWGAELSGDYSERTRNSAFREGATLIGILLATSLPFSIGLTEREGMRGLQAMAILVAILLPISGLAAVALVPEPKNRSSRELGRLGAPDWRGPLLLVYFACAVLGVPLGARAASRFGKHRAWCGAMLATCPIFALSGFLGRSDVSAFGVICLLTGLLLGFDLALPPSIQADVIDHDTARSGAQRSGLYFAAWSLATKLSLAAAVGLVFPARSAGGGSGSSSDAIAVLYSWLPIVPKLAAIWLMRAFRSTGWRRRNCCAGSGRTDEHEAAPADPKALPPPSRGGST
jgi:Na+/melibiose symporter-like transporter